MQETCQFAGPEILRSAASACMQRTEVYKSREVSVFFSFRDSRRKNFLPARWLAAFA